MAGTFMAHDSWEVSQIHIGLSIKHTAICLIMLVDYSNIKTSNIVNCFSRLATVK